MNTDPQSEYAFDWSDTGVTPIRWVTETYDVLGDVTTREHAGLDAAEALIAVACDVAQMAAARESVGLGCTVSLWHLESCPNEDDFWDSWNRCPGALCAALDGVTPAPTENRAWKQATDFTFGAVIDPVAQAIYDRWSAAVKILPLKGEFVK